MTMRLLAWVLLGFAPGLFWLWFFRRKDDLEPEPPLVVLRVFALGALATVPVLLLRPGLSAWLPATAGAGRDLADAFLVTAIPEEAAKLAALLAGVGFSREFDEPLDGVVYGVAAALGFASVENVLFLLAATDPWLVVQRAFTATLGHLAFTGVAGWAIGQARFAHGLRTRFLLPVAGFALAVLLHGGYDFLLFREGAVRYLALLLVLPLSLAILSIRLRAARARSPEFHGGQTPSSEADTEPPPPHR